jgi:hypothetical protein
VLAEGSWQPAYAGSGHLVFVRQGLLWAAPFDLDRLSLSGDPTPTAIAALTADGTLAYIGRTGQQTTVALVTRDGRERSSRNRRSGGPRPGPQDCGPLCCRRTTARTRARGGAPGGSRVDEWPRQRPRPSCGRRTQRTGSQARYFDPLSQSWFG